MTGPWTTSDAVFVAGCLAAATVIVIWLAVHYRRGRRKEINQ